MQTLAPVFPRSHPFLRLLVPRPLPSCPHYCPGIPSRPRYPCKRPNSRGGGGCKRAAPSPAPPPPGLQSEPRSDLHGTTHTPPAPAPSLSPCPPPPNSPPLPPTSPSLYQPPSRPPSPPHPAPSPPPRGRGGSGRHAWRVAGVRCLTRYTRVSVFGVSGIRRTRRNPAGNSEETESEKVADLLGIEGLFTQGSRPDRTVGESAGGFSKWTALIGRIEFGTMPSVPDPTLRIWRPPTSTPGFEALFGLFRFWFFFGFFCFLGFFGLQLISSLHLPGTSQGLTLNLPDSTSESTTFPGSACRC